MAESPQMATSPHQGRLSKKVVSKSHGRTSFPLVAPPCGRLRRHAGGASIFLAPLKAESATGGSKGRPLQNPGKASQNKSEFVLGHIVSPPLGGTTFRICQRTYSGSTALKIQENLNLEPRETTHGPPGVELLDCKTTQWQTTPREATPT